MSILDLILNLAGLLLWLNWRAVRVEPSRSLASPLGHMLKSAGPARKKSIYLAVLGGLLIVRALFYWQIGSATHWTPLVPFGPVVLAFRSDFSTRIFLFSLVSFGFTLAVFYLSLLLLSLVNGKISDGDPQQKWIRLQLGWLEYWPWFLKILLPPVISIAAWCVLSPLLRRAGIVPPPFSFLHLVEQGAIIGLASMLTWKFLIAAILVLHLVNSYVYLGSFSFWAYINATARGLLRPLSFIPLQFARLDFSPVVALAVVFLLAELASRGLAHLYQRLPL